MTNTQLFGHDEFTFRRQALLCSKFPLDFTYDTSVIGFEISGTEPPTTSRRIIFKIEDKLYRFVNSVLDEYVWRGELADILEHGNTVGELLDLNGIPAFVGKKVFVVIALDAPSNAPVMPKIKLAVKTNSFNDIYTKYEYSPIYELSENSKLVEITESKVEVGNATATSQVRVKKLSGWSDWAYLPEVQNQVASAVQFRTQFVLTTLDGTDSVSEHSITFKHTSDADKSAADFRYLYSKTEYFENDLKTGYLLVEHEPLEGARLEAFVSLTGAQGRREKIELGRGAGLEQVIYLPDKYFAQDSLHVEVNGTPFFDYDFDTERGALTLTVLPNQTITASYDYAPEEAWRPMTPDYSELGRTRFTYRTLSNSLRRGAFKIKLTGSNLPNIKGYIAGLAV